MACVVCGKPSFSFCLCCGSEFCLRHGEECPRCGGWFLSAHIGLHREREEALFQRLVNTKDPNREGFLLLALSERERPAKGKCSECNKKASFSCSVCAAPLCGNHLPPHFPVHACEKHRSAAEARALTLLANAFSEKLWRMKAC